MMGLLTLLSQIAEKSVSEDDLTADNVEIQENEGEG
jgi:hypothetical protein